MVRTGRRTRLGWIGALVAALLVFAPILGMGGNHASAQSSTKAAQNLLSDAQDLTDGLDPVVDNDAVTLTQEEGTVRISYFNKAADPIGDFYMTFTVEAPRDGDTDPFDFGLFFRDSADDSYLNLILASDMGSGPMWGFFEQDQNVDSGDLDPEVFPVEKGSTYEIEVAAIGDEAAFSVNGTAIALLDISNNPDPGRIGVGSGVFVDNTVAGDEVNVSDVTLFNLDEGGSAVSPTEEPTDEATAEPTDEATEEPTDEATEEATDEATEEPTDSSQNVQGDTYVSPTYGFTLTYDSDVWEVRSDEATGDDYDNLGLRNVDVLDMIDDASNVLLFSGESSNTPKECVQADIDFFKNSDRYDFVSIATDKNDEDLKGNTDSGDGYYTVVWLDDAGPKGNEYDQPQALTVYIECRPIVDGESMVLIEQYAFDADYNDEIAPREDLLAGLDMSTAGEPVDQPTEEPTDEATAAPTEQAANGEVVVQLDPVADDVDGEATLTPSGSTRTRIVITSDTAPEGALVVVQEGTCDDLAGESAFDAGVIDENGESSGRVRATIDDLDGNYAITLVDADTEDYADPLACGDIG